MEKETELLSAAASRLLSWYETVPRTLPWWNAPTPYHVWISEIMLQQTRTAAVIPYYTRFVSSFPDVASLASADDDLLMKMWEGLGYYSRARNLKRAARLVMSEYGGKIPDSREELLKLPGIGTYTAGAVASIAYGKPEPAVDGNVLRVVMRLCATGDDVLKDTTKRAVRDALSAVYPTGESARALTEGWMILGETVCKPGADAACAVCPLSDICRANLGRIVPLFPVRPQKKPRKIEELTVFLFRFGDGYAVCRRPEGGLLGGLFGFPNEKGKMTKEETRHFLETRAYAVSDIRPLGDALHVFTHVEWHMTGYEVTLSAPPADMTFRTAEDIRKNCAVPTAFRFYEKQMR